jgi:hypothetical protein
MNKQKKRIMQLRTIYEGVIEENHDEYIDQDLILNFNSPCSI